MELIGYYDSPFVRRVAITAQMLGIPYTHRELSIFRQYDEFREINPLVKVPTLIRDDGSMLVESTLIIDYLQSIAENGPSLMPTDPEDRFRALQLVGAALIVMEKAVQIIYETKHRPQELIHGPWLERVEQQMDSALQLIETAVAPRSGWLFGENIGQADISSAVAWRFVTEMVPQHVAADNYGNLAEFAGRAEALPAFAACSF